MANDTDLVHVLEPTDVWNPSEQNLWQKVCDVTRSNYEAMVASVVIPGNNTRTWHPDPSMRRLGYTMNPDRCIHFRKSYYSGKWTCTDCGEPL